MNFFSYLTMELKKLKRSKILLLLCIPVLMMWLPSIINSEKIFDTQQVPITPEHNFFIQGFMGMAWFMIPASLIICVVLLTQTEHRSRGILKMLSLPVDTKKLCLTKFVVLLLLAGIQMLMTIAAYTLSALLASNMQDYSFLLEPSYVWSTVFRLYVAAIPMAAVFWMLGTFLKSPVFSAGLGLASIVPSVLMINTKVWWAYPMSYPFYLLMVKYGKAAKGVYETQIAWLPWLPAAIIITIISLAVSCIGFGRMERS